MSDISDSFTNPIWSASKQHWPDSSLDAPRAGARYRVT